MRKYIGGTTIGNFSLDYFILETNRCYGIEIEQSDNQSVDSAAVFCVTRNRAEIHMLANQYLDLAVFPVSLADLVEDYLSERLCIA